MNDFYVRGYESIGGMMAHNRLERTPTDNKWADTMTHPPRHDISRICAAKSLNPRFRSVDSYKLAKSATKWLVTDTLQKS